MAFPTSVNNQITDAVTQANVKVLGDAPTVAMGNLYQVTSQALGDAAHRATTAQQQASVTCQAATTMGVSFLYSLDTAATGAATQEILQASEKSGGAAAGGEPAEVISGDHVVGYLYTILASPAGKAAVQAAVEQANARNALAADEPRLTAVHDALVQAIGSALQAGVSRQQVCQILHQVAYDRGISLLYPFDTGDAQLSAADIESYYQAIIAAYQTDRGEAS